LSEQPVQTADEGVAGPERAGTPDDGSYRVLARKYRPQTFDELIGQDAMVRTLANAFRTGRIAHAYMLTGVRGIGKTTTARLIARALNYTGPGGEDGPTIHMTGLGEHCQAIMEARHVDVIEMDAASRTGIGDVREIIESVRYRPSAARYKVYIIDEVHMLSPQAFNGLLKTLEEPPPHVKFVFATTEVRKVPVTVLSRCQRFDLRRIDTDVLAKHLAGVAGREAITVEPGALVTIARAAEGSVRDALSLLDQAAALGEGQVTAQGVRDMLGLADRERIIDLFEAVMAGDLPAALAIFADLYAVGAQPAVVLSDLADLVHWITRLKLVEGARNDPSMSQAERERGLALAERLGMRVLTRAWQMLLKGLTEMRDAANDRAAGEMVIIRLAHAADLPPPDEVIRSLAESSGNGPAARTATGGDGGPAATAQARGEPARQHHVRPVPSSGPRASAAASIDVQRSADADQPALPQPATFEEIVALAGARRDIQLKTELEHFVHLVSMQPGRLEIRVEPGARQNFVQTLSARLQEWTGRRWMVTVSNAPGAKTLKEQETERREALMREARSDPVVQAVLEQFPGAEIVEVREPFQATAEADHLDPADDATDD